MTFLSTASLVDDDTRATVALRSKATGRYVGRFGNFGPHCWDVKESIRNLYDKDIRPAILQRLDGRIGSVSSQDSISITVYMIGRRANSAVPTVLFVSENQGQRKEARKLIKGSGILGQHQGWKTAEAAKDPSWGGELEQLASGVNVSEIDCTESPTTIHRYYSGRDTDMEPLSPDVGMVNINHTKSPATQVFYDPSQPLRSRGLTLYVSHGSGLRIITANLLRANGKIYYQGPAHAFFEKIDKLSVHSVDSADDFEFDIDDETETIWADDNTVALSIPELDCQDSAAWSSDDSEDLDPVFAQDSDDDTSSQSSLETMDQDVTDPATTYEETSEVVFSRVADFKARAPAAKPYVPALESLLPFGVLSKWSTDRDWALIEVLIATEPDASAYFASTPDDISTMKIARPSSVEATVETHTTSSGRITGIIAGTPTDVLVPHGNSLQEVFSVRFDGTLADGDCGSAVIDVLTGELYGHIIAGCRATGFAYVMAASHTMPELQKSLSSPITVPYTATATSDCLEVISPHLPSGTGNGQHTDAAYFFRRGRVIAMRYDEIFPRYELHREEMPRSSSSDRWMSFMPYPPSSPRPVLTFSSTRNGKAERIGSETWLKDDIVHDPYNMATNMSNSLQTTSLDLVRGAGTGLVTGAFEPVRCSICFASFYECSCSNTFPSTDPAMSTAFGISPSPALIVAKTWVNPWDELFSIGTTKKVLAGASGRMQEYSLSCLLCPEMGFSRMDKLAQHILREHRIAYTAAVLHFLDRFSIFPTCVYMYGADFLERRRTPSHQGSHHIPAPDCLCSLEMHASFCPRQVNYSAAGDAGSTRHLSRRECNTCGHYRDSLESGAEHRSLHICHHRHHRPADPVIGRSTYHSGTSAWYCCRCTRASDASTICDPGPQCTDMLWGCSNCEDGCRGLGSQ